MKKLSNYIKEQEQSKKQKEYQDFFNDKLEKYGVKTPAELSDADKSKFFNEIDKEWKGVDEQAEHDDFGFVVTEENED